MFSQKPCIHAHNFHDFKVTKLSFFYSHSSLFITFLSFYPPREKFAIFVRHLTKTNVSMKDFRLTVLALASLLASCTTTEYIQVVDVQSSLPMQQNNYVHDDGTCRINYALWAEGGDAGFTVENLTDEILYLDLGKSFYIQNGTAHDYYLQRSFGKVTSAASANALSLTLNSRSSNVTTEEKEIMAIPPHASKSVREYGIADDVIQDCSVRLIPKKDKQKSVTYSEADSPLKFANYITYRLGEQGEDKSMTHRFHVQGFTNYQASEIEHKEKTGCKKQKTVKVCSEAKNTRYYIRYSNTHSRDFSADAQEPWKND